MAQDKKTAGFVLLAHAIQDKSVFHFLAIGIRVWAFVRIFDVHLNPYLFGNKTYTYQ